MDNQSRMVAGKLYAAGDEKLVKGRLRAKKLVQRFNQLPVEDKDGRAAILDELLGQTGDNCYIEPPFRCDYGSNIHIGKNFYANYEAIILDCAPVTIGDEVMFGPRVNVFTASHPIDAVVRQTGLEIAAPITIGHRVWIGGNVTLTPGVEIGDNTIIGAGSVVTKSIPANVVAAGNPCRVLRAITEEDKKYWEEQRQQYNEEEQTNF